jgi:hypothetical protein
MSANDPKRNVLQKTEIYNLERKPLVSTVFGALAEEAARLVVRLDRKASPGCGP